MSRSYRTFATVLFACLAIGVAGCPGHQSGGASTTGGSTDTTTETGTTEAETAAEAVFPEDDYRQQQPEPGTPRPFNLPQVKTFKLADQIDVYLIESHDLPTVSLEINLDGGSVNDPRGVEGLARICMSMMSEGTKKLDKIAFNESLADTASSVESYAGIETQGVSMRTLSKHFDATFALFNDTLLEPGFRKSDLDRMVNRSLESLKQAKGSASSVARRLPGKLLFGATHPFGRIRTEKSLKRIKINNCKAYHRQYVKPKGARLFVVGDMTEKQIRDKLAPLLKKWRGAPKRMTKTPQPKPGAGKLFFVDIPGSAQSSVSILQAGPERTDDDFFANQMMAMVLGGGFSSRINMNLREDKGYAYGAFGGFRYYREHGTFFAGSSVRSNATRQAVLELFDEIRGMKDASKPPTEAELSREKAGAVLGLPARFATSRDALGQYRSLVYFGLPLDYYNKYVDNVSAVTLEKVSAAAKKQLKPEEAKVLVVGDAKASLITRNDKGEDVALLDANGKPVTLLDGLKSLVDSGALGKGSLVVLDADGNVVKPSK